RRLLDLKNAGAQISLVQIYSATRPAPNSQSGHLPLKVLSRIAQTVRQSSGLTMHAWISIAYANCVSLGNSNELSTTTGSLLGMSGCSCSQRRTSNPSFTGIFKSNRNSAGNGY